MAFYGILEEPTSKYDCSPIFFPSKVGGEPVWLDRSSVPDLRELKCKLCNSQMIFLLQIYYPLDQKTAYHRTLYLFCCPTSKCYQESNIAPFIVLRSALEQVNDYYSPSSLPDLSDEEAESITKKLYTIFPPKKWAVAQFKEYLIILENYPVKNQQNTDRYIKKQMEILENIPQTNIFDKDTEKELDELADRLQKQQDKDIDIEFEQFSESFACASQVARYDRKGTPIFVSCKNKITDDEIPICCICKEKFVFEFQIYPQILNYLKFKKAKNVMDIDFGTVLIYTCPNSCKDVGDNYFEEFARKQDYTV